MCFKLKILRYPCNVLLHDGVAILMFKVLKILKWLSNKSLFVLKKGISVYNILFQDKRKYDRMEEK